jgi:hypothetical protein
MTQRKGPPATRRSFASIWDELDYLSKRISYWLYSRRQKTSAERYLERLERVLHDLPENDVAIIRENGLALLHELKGDIDKAIAHRKREMELMEKLHKEAQSSRYADATRAYMLHDRGMNALRVRRVILKTLRKTKAGLSSNDLASGRRPEGSACHSVW